jgi:hypothetical protein
MQLHPLAWVVLLLAFAEGGWLAYDGARALIVGDYVTPKSGQFAGRLGPWSKLVSAIGIEPRSALMKSVHLVIGVVWLAVMACYVLGYPWAWAGMLVCAFAGIWYLPFGTLLSIIQIILLWMPALRSAT